MWNLTAEINSVCKVNEEYLQSLLSSNVSDSMKINIHTNTNKIQLITLTENLL